MNKRSIIYILFEWLLFFFITIAAITNVNRLFLPKYTYQNSSWPTTNSLNGFYQMERESVDVLLLGSSVAVNAFSPQQIYNDYGIRSYNLGSEQQSIFHSYYWLKEALRFQKPQVVVLDLMFLPTIHPEDPLNTTEGLTRKCFDFMRWSSIKAEAVHDIARQTHVAAKSGKIPNYQPQSEMSYYFPNIRYHNRWSSGLNYADFDKEGYMKAPLKGWSTLIFYADPEYKQLVPFVRGISEPAKEVELNKLQVEYLRKIGELCKEKNIQLMLVNLPGNYDPAGMQSFDQKCADLAVEIGADYYNYSDETILREIGAVQPLEWVGAHANYWGSVKLSRYTGKILSEEYGVQPVQDEQFESTKDFYAEVGKDANLQYLDDFERYLDAVNDKNYSIFISIKDEGTAALTEKMIVKLSALGIKTELKNRNGCSWAAMIDSQKGVVESSNDATATELRGVFGPEPIHWSIVSAGSNTGSPSSSININGVEYSPKERGINIVVWDKVGRTVVDAVAFDTHDQLQATRYLFRYMLERNENINNTRW